MFGLTNKIMKKIVTLFAFLFFFLLVSCGKSNSTPTSTTDEPSTTITTPQDDKTITKEDETANMKLTLKINDIENDVIWTNND